MTPRHLSLVRFIGAPSALHGDLAYPFTALRTYVFLGEIPNLPGHCVVAEHPTGPIYSGYHSELFRELTFDEI